MIHQWKVTERQKHADCSETFAKRELESEIKGAPTKSKEEREQMLDLLRRFEEEDAKGEENEEEEEGNELTMRLSSIDLGMSLKVTQFDFDLMSHRMCFI